MSISPLFLPDPVFSSQSLLARCVMASVRRLTRLGMFEPDFPSFAEAGH
jgi:hypothetical protein